MVNKGRLLIVEDDTSILELMHIALTGHGQDYECVLCTNGEKALDILKKDHDFIMIITDIVMPGISGIELTKKIKRQFPKIPVMVMTGFIDDFTYDQVMDAGADDFIKKPFTIKELCVRVAKAKQNAELLAAIKKNEKEIEQMGNEMIAGLQEESLKRLKKLQQEIEELKKLVW